ncbi:hypothetical protein EVAR_75330_1 [Eumeta japonica]|uniref:Uncharacterized protein n=1 Tax=Eumeta variegata TaxID=151549 RepID=A0A4C1XYN5_EUMVA|nr:hypothetical protein EVAR_75330_1 [Eumeta japonica]
MTHGYAALENYAYYSTLCAWGKTNLLLALEISQDQRTAPAPDGSHHTARRRTEGQGASGKYRRVLAIDSGKRAMDSPGSPMVARPLGSSSLLIKMSAVLATPHATADAFSLETGQRVHEHLATLRPRPAPRVRPAF